MIQKRTITEHVKNLIKDKFIIHTNKLSSSTDLQKDLLFGNMDINIILFYVENLFHIEIEKTEESDIKKVGDLSEIICKKLSTSMALA